MIVIIITTKKENPIFANDAEYMNVQIFIALTFLLHGCWKMFCVNVGNHGQSWPSSGDREKVLKDRNHE